MATIAKTSVSNGTASTVSVTTLSSSDTFVFTKGTTAIMVIRNDTGSSVSPVIDGDGGTIVDVTGIGPVDVSAGTDIFGSIADGAQKAIKLNSVSKFLQGTIAVTGASGAEATIIELTA